MLTVKKIHTLTGESAIDGVIAERYQAQVSADAPKEPHVSIITRDAELLRANLEECRKDRAEFEDAAYALFDELKEAAAD